ncbi:MAG: hypothetical protein ACOYKZ_06635 [Chlamydiia bacterium]
MSRNAKSQAGSELANNKLSLVEAVENLSHLADMQIEVTPLPTEGLTPEEQALVQDTLHHLSSTVGNPVDAVRETFETIHNYVRDFYRRQYSKLSDPKVRHNFRSLMAMVGEAGRKLDRCTTLFQSVHRASDLSEYQAIQHFFQSKLAKPLGETPEQNLEQLATRTLQGENHTHLIQLHARAAEDLQKLVDDSDYELFFLKKEDGTTFFTPQLLRNLQVIHQLGSSLPEALESDPLVELREILDLEAHHRSRTLLQAGNAYWHDLTRHAAAQADSPLFGSVYRAMLSLMLAGNSRNLLAALPVKNSLQYFNDFVGFLTEAISSDAYQQMAGELRPSSEQALLLGLTHELCLTLFLFPADVDLFEPYINKLIKSGVKDPLDDAILAIKLLQEDQCIRTTLKRYPSGPMLKMLDFISAEDLPATFDPILQENFPSLLCHLRGEGLDCELLRLPSPTQQGTVGDVYPNRLFEGFLNSYLLPAGPKRHLLINIQDRTSWRDYPRCRALEELPRLAAYLPHLTVVTLAKNTDFYHQVSPYDEISDANDFIRIFQEQIVGGEEFGYYFPPGIRTSLPDLFQNICLRIWVESFAQAAKLDRDQRLVFIDLAHCHLVEELLYLLKPASCSFTDKDGVDGAPCATTLFYLYWQWRQNPDWRPTSMALIHTMLFAPALVIRERELFLQPLLRLAQTAYFLQAHRILPYEQLEESA